MCERFFCAPHDVLPDGHRCLNLPPGIRLSLCTIAYDEEPFLRGCLESVQHLVNEIVLGVDSRTTDKTAEIARSFGARVIPFEWHDSFAEARNVTLERARGDWVLVIDPDERLLFEGTAMVMMQLYKLEDLSDLIDGFSPLFAEIDAQGNITSVERVAGRLFRNSPHLRYVGRIHEEVRYLPDPARTWFEPLEGTEPHIAHLGGTPEVRARRAKDERDTRLLNLRLEDNLHDAVALFYLAQMARDAGRADEAAAYARRALECGPRALHPDRIPQLEAFLCARHA